MIDHLQEEKNIWITNKKLKDPNQSLKIFYVIEPFDKNRLDKISKRLKMSILPQKLEKIILYFNRDGIDYMKYPFIITRIEIADNIYEDLEEEHGISLNDYTLSEWENIQELELWEKCEIQIARELIAVKLCDDLKLFT